MRDSGDEGDVFAETIHPSSTYTPPRLLFFFFAVALEPVYLHLHVPILRQRMNKIWSRGCNLIIHSPRTSQFARAALRRRLQREQRDNVTRIRVEDLLIGRVGRAADHTCVFRRPAQVLDV